MKSKLLYGVVGVGHLGNFHVQQIQKNSRIELGGVFDTNTKQSKAIAKKYNTHSFKTNVELYKTCDVVSIVTPAPFHYQEAILGLSHGCHLFIEKPFTIQLEDAEEIISLANKKDLLIQIGHIERFNPVFKKFEGLQSNPLFIESQRLSPFNVRGSDIDVILDLMIHDIDLVLHLVQHNVSDVHAAGVSVLSSSYDLVNARLGFDNGAVANLTASRLSASPLRKMRIFEKNQYYSLNFQKLKIKQYITQNKKTSEKTVFNHNNKYVIYKELQAEPINALYEELDSFILSIYENIPIRISKEVGRDVLKVALQIKNKIDEQKQQN